MAWLPHCVTPSLEPHIRPHDINTTNLQRRLAVHPRWLVSVLYHGRACTGTRISTGYPSTTPVGLALGPDSPWEDELDPGTLSHPADRILTYQFVTHACILTRITSTTRSPGSFNDHTTLPYQTTNVVSAASAVHLSPTTLSAHDHLTSELLRTLSRMAASKPTSWLSSRSHILFHLVHA